MKIGRNDPCPCKSGKKFKHCHLGRSSSPLHNPGFQQKALEMFDNRLREETKRRKRYGEVMPVIHTRAFGGRIVGVGNRIYKIEERVTFREFLITYLQDVMGRDWWSEQGTKHPIARHALARWQTAIEGRRTNTPSDKPGRFAVEIDGNVAAFLSLAHDLYLIEQNTPFQTRIIDRLRSSDNFAGARYELMVAASFARAGFRIFPEDETDESRRHVEFLAHDKHSSVVIAVEAKAKNRRQNDKNPTNAQVGDLIDDAVGKASPDVPYALFVDVAMPPLPHPDDQPAWLTEVDDHLKWVSAKFGRAPFDVVFFTNTPHRFAQSGTEAPIPNTWHSWIPWPTTRLSSAVLDRITNAIEQSENIPDFEEPAETS